MGVGAVASNTSAGSEVEPAAVPEHLQKQIQALEEQLQDEQTQIQHLKEQLQKAQDQSSSRAQQLADMQHQVELAAVQAHQKDSELQRLRSLLTDSSNLQNSARQVRERCM